MIPTQFDYVSPTTLAEAVRVLAEHADEAKILAGGHSLIPAMKLRLAQPQLLIDLGRISDLAYIRDDGSHIRIGAMTTHFQLESSATLQQSCPLLSQCASHIGDVQVRNKGTIGGSLAHADPAGDWPAAIIALNARLIATGATGDKEIGCDNFFVDLLTTALLPGEILREIRIEKPVGRFGHAYEKVRHPASGFAVVGVAVSLEVSDDGKCAAASVGITGVASKAYRASGVEAALKGKALDAQTISSAAARVCDGIDANSDLYASDEYRKHLAMIYVQRGIKAALANAERTV